MGAICCNSCRSHALLTHCTPHTLHSSHTHSPHTALLTHALLTHALPTHCTPHTLHSPHTALLTHCTPHTRAPHTLHSSHTHSPHTALPTHCTPSYTRPNVLLVLPTLTLIQVAYSASLSDLSTVAEKKKDFFLKKVQGLPWWSRG